jgi:molecular chaperone GrpE
MPSSHDTDARWLPEAPDARTPGERESGFDRGLAPGADETTPADDSDPLQNALLELAQLEDRYARARADLENYRKRSAREQQRLIEQARESMLLNWLEVADSVDRAAAMQADDSPCREGLLAVRAQIDTVLARDGVQRIGAPGEPFDPEHHEAVATRSLEAVPDRSVLDVVRSGFALGGRVIRPAQVVVARSPDPPG